MNQDADSSQNSRKRQVAIKLLAKHIMGAPFVEQEGWDSNYLEIGNIKAARINIIGHLVSKDDRQSVIDDGTGSIALRTFEPLPQLVAVEIGTCVLVVGRPREYQGERYVIAEIVRPIDKAWLEVRAAELSKLEYKSEHQKSAPKEAVTPAAEAIVEEEEVSDTPERKLYDLIKHEDTGAGADAQTVCDKVPNGDAVMKKLLEQGDIFEVSPGKIKVLE